MHTAIGLVVGLGLLSSQALAQSRQDPLEACYQQPDGAPRLACFNREMQRRQAASAPTGGSPATATVTGAAAATGAPAATAPGPAPPAAASDARVADAIGFQGSALRKKLEAAGVSPDAVKPIVARVVRMVPRPHSVQAYVLDNGQTWEPVETLDNLNVRLQDTVTIKAGILGAFFLSTPRSQTVRVHRLL